MGKRGPDRGFDGGQGNYGDIYTLPLIRAGTLASGAAQAHVDVPVRSEVVGLFMSLATTGATSGATTINIGNATDSNELFAAGDRPSIAYNAANSYLEKAASTMQNHTSLDAGDVLALDIDAVPGTASTDLAVTLILRRI